MNSKRVVTVNYKISRRQLTKKYFILNLKQMQPLGYSTRYSSKTRYSDRINIS